MNQEEKTCMLCGTTTVWENPEIPGHFHESSNDIEDWPICHDCMIEHCCHTDCDDCEYKPLITSDCRFFEMKQIYSEPD
jgi:hypothetical protein